MNKEEYIKKYPYYVEFKMRKIIKLSTSQYKDQYIPNITILDFMKSANAKKSPNNVVQCPS
jgi:hypothetical protein